MDPSRTDARATTLQAALDEAASPDAEVDISHLAFKCEWCRRILLVGANATYRDNDNQEWCAECAFFCSGCGVWYNKETNPDAVCDKCGHLTCHACVPLTAETQCGLCGDIVCSSCPPFVLDACGQCESCAEQMHEGAN